MTWKKLSAAVIGDPAQFSVQARLFNVASLMVAVWDAFFAATSKSVVAGHHTLYLAMYAGSAAIVLVGYAYSRLRGNYRMFLAPIWIVPLAGISITWLLQGGSQGTVAFAVFPLTVGGLIITPGRRAKYFGIAFLCCFALGLVLLDYLRPDLIVAYPSQEARFWDYLQTYILSILLTGIVTVYFVGNYQRVSDDLNIQKKKIENLIANLRRYLPSQLVRSLENETAGTVTAPRRRRITIFFSDIKDFTGTTDSLQPEDLTELLNEYLTEMTVVATRWGGTIDKFVGDAMMIFFGAPDSRGDDIEALSCVRMAIEMQQRMKTLGHQWYEMGIEKPLEIRIGINTGVAAVGDFGAHDRLSYTAIGGEVNLASRLEELSRPGGIIISHTTWALVKDSISCTRREKKVRLKGIGHDVTAYDVAVDSIRLS